MNRICAAIHATFQFSLTVYYWIFLNTSVDFNRDNKYIKDFEISCHDYMMGYLIYDVIIEIIGSRNKLNLMHHIIGYASHLSVRLTDSHAGRFYSMLVFIAEGSTPWLHTSWIMHQLEKTSSVLYYICVLNTVICFFVFRYHNLLISLLKYIIIVISIRVLLSPYIFFHLNWYKSEWNNPNYSTNFNETLYFCNWLVILFFFVLNYYWFVLLMKMVLSAVLGSKKSKKKD